MFFSRGRSTFITLLLLLSTAHCVTWLHLEPELHRARPDWSGVAAQRRQLQIQEEEKKEREQQERDCYPFCDDPFSRWVTASE